MRKCGFLKISTDWTQAKGERANQAITSRMVQPMQWHKNQIQTTN